MHRVTKKRGADNSVTASESHSRRLRPSPFEIGSSSKNGASHDIESTGSNSRPSDDVVCTFVDIPALPSRTSRFQSLSASEIKELEKILEFEATNDSWRDDWTGNLAFIDKDVRNPKEKGNEKNPFRQPLIDWALKAHENKKYVINLIRYVLSMSKTPEAAKRILTNVDQSPADLEKAIRLTSYHPIVLQQDGWTTMKSAEPQPPIGGPFLIGDRIRWEHSDAVIIAYVRDPDIGDLWKAISIDRDDHHTFDLEAEEVLDARQKYDRRQQKNQTRKSSRFAGSSEFRVSGLEHGIVLAASYSKGARPGVYWPARVMHASETNISTGKRSSSKQKVDVVFLSPYWSSDDLSRPRRTESLSENVESAISTAPLLQIETIEASEEMIRPYQYESHDTMDLEVLRTSFHFTGLPKALFGRFVNSHRLALALRRYAKFHLDCETSSTEQATAGLFECHPMTVLAPVFPSVVLHLPLSYIVDQLPLLRLDPRSSGLSIDGSLDYEPIIDLHAIVQSMTPPACYGQSSIGNQTPPRQPRLVKIQTTPSAWLACMQDENGRTSKDISAQDFFQGLSHLNEFFFDNSNAPAVRTLQRAAIDFIETARESEKEVTVTPRQIATHKLNSWSLLKMDGEQIISSLVSESSAIRADWRRFLERIYKFLVNFYSAQKQTLVLSDLRCNLHLTGNACFERSVRLPAALKAAKLAGATVDGSLKLVLGVEEKFVEMALNRVLVKAHTAPYLKRMKGRCESAASEEAIIRLTDDSDGRGGEDTMGCKGTWSAAVSGVAAALQVTHMVVHGEFNNGFCVSRPPGHHAGRSLHPMKAISNGFCVLNTAACAAIYAVTPISDGGLGLSRACIIDFDVHHGNGTQDILCNTYDPRFFYISLHAGGAEVNGVPHDDKDDPNNELHELPSNPKSGGIYPGRCGDSSPHMGVLNIPLGVKVTPHGVGTALVQQVTPAVDKFSPDIIILSAGFDAHKNDPMGLGALSAEDFGHITVVACNLAAKSCSGRLVSVLEGGYGVPCCRMQRDVQTDGTVADTLDHKSEVLVKERLQPTALLDLGDDLPDDMDDQVPYALQRRLEKCHAEGFVECVREHIAALAKCRN